MERPRELQDPGEWLTWVDSNAPVGQREEDTGRILENWARVDFRATAAWIGEQPAGPLRDRSTYVLAETVAPHEPASAVDWALTLPPSQERTELLQNIHRHWQGKDEDAAAAFAAEQGLSPAQPSGTNLIDP